MTNKLDHNSTIHRIPTNTTPITSDESQSCKAAHEIIILNNMGERECQLGTAKTRSPRGNYSRSIMESNEMAPGAIPNPDRVPEQELLSPGLGFLVASELRCVSGENL